MHPDERVPNRGRSKRSWCGLWLALVLLVAFILSGCVSPTYRTPEIAGVVTVVTDGGNSVAVYALKNGGTFAINTQNGDGLIVNGASPPDVGELLLGGTGPDGPWIARLSRDQILPEELDCFALRGAGTDRGRWIEADAGFRLPKAAHFEAVGETEGDGERDTVSISPRFCVNSDGQVTSFQ